MFARATVSLASIVFGRSSTRNSCVISLISPIYWQRQEKEFGADGRREDMWSSCQLLNRQWKKWSDHQWQLLFQQLTMFSLGNEPSIEATDITLTLKSRTADGLSKVMVILSDITQHHNTHSNRKSLSFISTFNKMIKFCLLL